ncbi:hypothetical protein KR018_001417, partial [Drosophila ironensis]
TDSEAEQKQADREPEEDPADEAEQPDDLVDFTRMLRQHRNGPVRTRDYGERYGSSSNMPPDPNNTKGFYMEQYVLGVLDFSSQYGIDYSISYTAANVIGRPTKFPAYGDYPETFTMRTYGDWWQKAPSATREIQVQNMPKVATHDYIVVYFEEFVVPTEVVIFETYNPGAVVRIWGYGMTKKWTCLWEASPKDVVRQPAYSRRFSPPLKDVSIITKTLRIDFNHTPLNYYTEIDAIMLCGRSIHKLPHYVCKQHHHLSQQRLHHRQLLPTPPPIPEDEYPCPGPITTKLRTLKFQPKCDEHGPRKLTEFINNDLGKFLKENPVVEIEAAPSSHLCLTDLPFEILLRIFSYLDLKSLFRVGQVSRSFYDISSHPLLYGEISLKNYWHLASSELLCTLAKRATMLRKLDLSWCGGLGNVSPTEFKKFITQRGDNLTHLRLNSCKFLNSTCIDTVGIVCDNLTELSLRNCATDPPLWNFSCLANLKNLERLDLFQTAFETELLLSMLESNRKLKHLNLGECGTEGNSSSMWVANFYLLTAFCGVSVNMDSVAEQLAIYNTQLISLDLWKAHFLTARGLQSLASLRLLEELDLGWCLREATLGDGLYQLLLSCPRLKKLFLSAVRGTTESDLTHIAALGKNLEQLDLMGILNITHERVYDILVNCPKLQMLDLSFCDNIMDHDVSISTRKQSIIKLSQSILQGMCDVLTDWALHFNVDIKCSRIH